jgi:hypothetical protein
MALAVMAGWRSSQPSHRALEAVAREIADVEERDAAARAAFENFLWRTAL